MDAFEGAEKCTAVIRGQGVGTCVCAMCGGWWRKGVCAGRGEGGGGSAVCVQCVCALCVQCVRNVCTYILRVCLHIVCAYILCVYVCGYCIRLHATRAFRFPRIRRTVTDPIAKVVGGATGRRGKSGKGGA